MLPSLGMLVASFTHRGDELVALPGGLAAYRAGHTTGIPLLYPWANRLARDRYRVGNVEVDLRGLDLHTDDNGLPIHGMMLARPEWEVTRLGAGPRSARLAARFDFGAHEDLMAAFPFPHEVAVDVTLAATGLRIVTTTCGRTVRSASRSRSAGTRTSGCRVALASAWELGAARRARTRALDGRGIPTGRARPGARPRPAPLAGPRPRRPLRARPGPDHHARRGDRRLTVTYDDGYPYAQVYSPTGKPFCAIEPMTAPTNALVSRRPPVRSARVRPSPPRSPSPSRSPHGASSHAV